MMRNENGNSYNDKRQKKNIWCLPSCISVSIVIVLIVLLVLVPLLDQQMIMQSALPSAPEPLYCSDECRLSLVETIPEGLTFPPNVTHTSTTQAYLDMINAAQTTIEIVSYYWTLRFNEISPHISSIEGEQVFEALYAAGSKPNIDLKIVENMPTESCPSVDTEYLVNKNAAQVRSLNFSKILGTGVLHTKFWIIDRQHFYIGSANMDWRGLTQMKELGIVAYNCSCLATDLGKIFDVYWTLGEKDAVVPNKWPANLSTDINLENPINITDQYHSFGAYITSSPPQFSPRGRTSDDDAIVSIIESAEEFVHISVVNYAPELHYTPKLKFWPKIDNAIRCAALERKVKVKMLVGWWRHTMASEKNFLRSLLALTAVYPGVDLQVKRFMVPSTPEQAKIHNARVHHNKFMVTERAAYIGTSNWAGDYFVETAGVAFIQQEPRGANVTQSVRAQLEDVFQRDWNSPYAETYL